MSLAWWERAPVVVFERAGEHVARKRYTCTNCYHDIEPGTTYYRRTALVDGEFIDDKWHWAGLCKPFPPTDQPR